MNNFNDKRNDAHLNFCVSRSNRPQNLSHHGRNLGGQIPAMGIMNNRAMTQTSGSFYNDGFVDVTHCDRQRYMNYGTPRDTYNNKVLSHWAAQDSYNNF